MTKYQILLGVYTYLEEEFQRGQISSADCAAFIESLDPYVWTNGYTADRGCYAEFLTILRDITDKEEFDEHESYDCALEYLRRLNESGARGDLSEAVLAFESCPFGRWDETLLWLTENETKKFRCPCCGYYTLTESGEWEICDVCFWEDDPIQSASPDSDAGANGISLNEARENFAKYGAMDEKSVPFVRLPTAEEVSGIVKEPDDSEA